VIRGRLCRKSNPNLEEERQTQIVKELMSARRAVKEAGKDEKRLRFARKAVHAAKVALVERGPVWWTDGAPRFQPVFRQEYAVCAMAFETG